MVRVLSLLAAATSIVGSLAYGKILGLINEARNNLHVSSVLCNMIEKEYLLMRQEKNPGVSFAYIIVQNLFKFHANVFLVFA